MRLLILVILLVSSVAAQRTWIVHSGGKGDFLDIPQALAMASHGDSIYVTGAGPFTSASTSLGVTVFASSTFGHLPSGVFTVHDLPAGESFALLNFGSTLTLNNFALVLRNNKGRVQVDNIRYRLPGSTPGQSPGFLHIENCDDVFINGSLIVGLKIVDSRVQVSQCRINGNCDVAFPRNSGITGIGADVLRSHVTFVSPQIIAERTRYYAKAPHGILAVNSDIIVAGDSTDVVAGHIAFGPGLAGTSIWADGGTVVIDPDIRLVVQGLSGVPVTGGTATFTRRQIPATLGTSNWPGLSFPMSVHHLPGSLAGLLVSLPAPRSPHPFGDFWLDPASMFPVGLGTMTGTGTEGHVDLPVPLPKNAFPLGTTFAFQAVVFDGQRLEFALPVRASVIPRFPPP